MNKALFEVNEEVRTVFNNYSNFEKIRIIGMKWQEGELGIYGGVIKAYTGWTYSLDDGVDLWADEPFLRKLPDTWNGSFNELIKQLNTETELQYEHGKERIYE